MMLIRTIKTLLVLLLLITGGAANSQFKVVGYMWSRAGMVQDFEKLKLDKITHLNIAFINPSPEGIISDLSALDTIVPQAHKNNVKVLLSCGGGRSHAYYAKLLLTENRQQLVNAFIAFVDKYNLDGIDVDLEGNDIDENYEAFILSLKKPLTKRKKLLTSAVAWWTRDRITDRALKQFDFINIMAYDKTGPWKPENGGQHSPLNYAEDHLTYWHKERGLPKKALVLGVPFYGYGFGSLADKDNRFRQMSWSDVQEKYPDSVNDDEIVYPDNGGSFFYNGKKTIEEKTKLAVKQGGGIMIWQLLYDAPNEHSLLDLINRIKKQSGW